MEAEAAGSTNRSPVKQGKERLHVAQLGSGPVLLTAPNRMANKSPGNLSAIPRPSCILSHKMVVG